jgi:dimethylamine--corrinoid protein Co-methyltransferase
VGDPVGMAITHSLASGMGGMRTTGDLVARMQMTKGMKINEAKEYVAGKLKVGVEDLANEAIAREIREQLNIGLVHHLDGFAKGMEAKFRIGKLLDIPIKSVSNFINNAGLSCK